MARHGIQEQRARPGRLRARLRRQDKSREVRPGRKGVVSSKITMLARGARFSDSLSESRKARPTGSIGAHREKKSPYSPKERWFRPRDIARCDFAPGDTPVIPKAAMLRASGL